MALTGPQDRALRAIDEEGTYGQYRASTTGSPNWYHPQHRPGNTYVDARTALVLIEAGLAEVRWNRLHRTQAGTDLVRSTRRPTSEENR